MLYRIHKRLENFLTFYFEHSKSHKSLSTFTKEQKPDVQKSQVSKGGKSIRSLTERRKIIADV